MKERILRFVHINHCFLHFALKRKLRWNLDKINRSMFSNALIWIKYTEYPPKEIVKRTPHRRAHCGLQRYPIIQRYNQTRESCPISNSGLIFVVNWITIIWFPKQEQLISELFMILFAFNLSTLLLKLLILIEGPI